MTKKFLSSKELINTLDEKDETIRRGDGFIVGVIKKSEDADTICVSLIGPTEWVELPLKMIESAKIVGDAMAGADHFQVVLIKLRQSDDPFAKVAYRLLSQVSTVGSIAADGKGCSCRQGEVKGEGSSNAAHGGSQMQARRVGGGVFGGAGAFGLGVRCRFVFRCYDCTRCIPFTDLCWSSTCCDLAGFECGFG